MYGGNGCRAFPFSFRVTLKKKLNTDFYLREDVVEISKELLGKFLVTSFNGEYSSGIITETEAYNGVIDRASHAYNNRRTKRNEIMYAEGGVAYIYLCYGMHHLFNIVTNKKDIPHAILIRAIMAWEGIDIMSKRRNKKTDFLRIVLMTKHRRFFGRFMISPLHTGLLPLRFVKSYCRSI